MKAFTLSAIAALALSGGFAASGPAAARDLSVVVYDSDLGLVRQTVEFDVARGPQTVSFTDIPGRIDPSSVRLEPGAGVRLIGQEYRPASVNTHAVLSVYTGKTVSLWLKSGAPMQGTLLSFDGDILLRDSSGKILILRPETVERYEFPELPAGLVNRPTLFWTLDSDRTGKTAATLSYLTGGLAWRADYDAVLNAAETAMDLSGAVTVENASGMSYGNAVLKLVAGTLHRAQSPAPAPVFRLGKSAALAAGADRAAEFDERAVSDYHLYELRGRTSIPDGGMKRISLIDPAAVKVERRFVFDAARNPADVMTVAEFVNGPGAGPNVPLPAGKVRLYRREESDGSLVLVGEDAIGHTPKNEKVRLTLGAAFDIRAERRVMDSRAVSQRVNEQRFDIELRNRKTEAVAVTVVERLAGDWEIVQKTHDFVKKDAATVEFAVKVPAEGSVTVSYTARMKY